METKKSLRRQLETANSRIADLEKYNQQAASGLDTLEDLGYEPITSDPDFWGYTETSWRTSEAQSAKNTARDAEFAEHVEQMKADAAHEARREALTLVIEALEIPGYVSGDLRAMLTGDSRDHIDRFHADLTTAVEVRRDIAAAAERGKVEKKVSELLKRESKNWATGGYVAKGETIVTKADLANSASIDALASALNTLNPVTRGAAEFAKSTTTDHDVATAGETLEDAA